MRAYFFDKVRFKFDSLRSLNEQSKQNLKRDRFKIVYMDAQRAYFWRLLVLFYQNLVLQSVDYELYPYLSVQLVNVIGCGIARQAALQSDLYFESLDSMKDEQMKLLQRKLREPSRELLSLSFCKYTVLELISQMPTCLP